MQSRMKRYQGLRKRTADVGVGRDQRTKPPSGRDVPALVASLVSPVSYESCRFVLPQKGAFFMPVCRPSEARQSVGVQSARPSGRLVRNKCGQRQPTPCDVAKTPATALVNTCDSRSQCVRKGQVPEDGRVTGMRGRHKGAGGNRVIRSRLAERCWHEPRMEGAEIPLEAA